MGADVSRFDLTLTDGLIAAYFLALVLALLLGRWAMNSPWLFLLRSFIPNWRFFHALGFTPRLFVRSRCEDEQWSDWVMMMPRGKRQWSHLFYNADLNLAMAEQTLVEHLSTDISDLPEGGRIEETTTYPMVERLVRLKLLPSDPAQTLFQFCVCLFPTERVVNFENDMILLSPELVR
jgi:hypothetical protein